MGNILVRIKYKKLVFKIFSIQFSKKSWWSRWVWQRSINCERDNVSENFLPSIEREVNAFEKMAGWLVIFPLCIQLSGWEDGYRSQVWPHYPSLPPGLWLIKLLTELQGSNNNSLNLSVSIWWWGFLLDIGTKQTRLKTSNMFAGAPSIKLIMTGAM